MLPIDLSGKRAFVAGVADDGGFGFAIAKALAAAGASVCVGTWPPALGIFETLLRRGKLDASLAMPDGSKLEFENIYADTTLIRSGTWSSSRVRKGNVQFSRASMLMRCAPMSIGAATDTSMPAI